MFEGILDILSAWNALLFIIGGVVVSGFGLLMLGYLVYVRLFERRYPADIVGVRTDKPGAKMYYPLIGYCDESGTRREAVSRGGVSMLLGATPGAKVTIFVSRADRDTVMLVRDWWALFVVAGILVASGAPFLAIGFEALQWTRGTALAVIALTAFLGWKFHEGSAPAVIAMRRGWKAGREAFIAKRKQRKTKHTVVVSGAEIEAQVAAERKQASFARPIVMAVGIAMLLGGAFWYQSTTAFVKVALAAEGIVVRNEASDPRDGATYHAVVRFTDEHDRRVTYKDSIGSSPPLYRTGDRVRVLYSPADAESAMIDRGIWNWLVPLVIAAAGALMFLSTAWTALNRAASMPVATSANSLSPGSAGVESGHVSATPRNGVRSA